VTEHNHQIHQQVADLLSAYIDDQVTADERILVEAHLGTCAECSRDLAMLRQTVTLLKRLPQVAAPRPFTLREADVTPERPSRPVWWRLPWVQGLAAAAAVFACVVAVGGGLLLGRLGSMAVPAAPAPLAYQATSAEEAPAQEAAGEAEPEMEAPLEEAREAVPTSVTEETAAAEKAAPAEPAADEVGGMAEQEEAEMPAAAPPPQPTASPQEMAEAEGMLPTSSPAAAPLLESDRAATPTAVPEALALNVAELDVEDVSIEIEPGLIQVSGRLPLSEGRLLAAGLWRDEELTDWSVPNDEPIEVQSGGQFSLRLQKDPAAQDYDLFSIEPADYEIRLYTVDAFGPAEARIPFDTYGPAPVQPTEAATEQADEAQASATPLPTPTQAPVPPNPGPVPPQEGPSSGVMVPPRLLVVILGIGGVALLLAALVGVVVYYLRSRG
jgi:hypothetical protein